VQDAQLWFACKPFGQVLADRRIEAQLSFVSQRKNRGRRELLGY